MNGFFGDWHALAILVLAGFIPNEAWRLAGLWLGGGAGVIAQILVHPPGALASVPDWLRYGAVAAGFCVFMATRRSIFAGVVFGEIVMLAGKWWVG
jgi:hypothetical protein